MKISIIYIVLLFNVILFGATISGDQNRVSVNGGSVDVSSNGQSVTLNSGEITFVGKNQAPSQPKKASKQDLQSIQNELDASSDTENNKRLLNLKFPPLNKKFMNALKDELIEKGIKENLIKFYKDGDNEVIYLRQVENSSIEELYPAYAKIINTYYDKKPNTKKIPSLKMKLGHIKRYHKELYVRYN